MRRSSPLRRRVLVGVLSGAVLIWMLGAFAGANASDGFALLALTTAASLPFVAMTAGRWADGGRTAQGTTRSSLLWLRRGFMASAGGFAAALLVYRLFPGLPFPAVLAIGGGGALLLERALRGRR